MNHRWHAVVTITYRRIYETVISPSLYVAISLGLLLGYFLVTGFVQAVDTSGLNYFLNPVYELIARALSGTFGETYVIKLFAEGPYLFALYVSFLPFLLYMAISSVFRFGLEKNVGAMELVTYGPADVTSYFLAFLIRNIFFTLIYCAVLLGFFSLTALLNNLVLGPQFFYGLLMAVFLSVAVYAYGTLTSTLVDNASVGTAVFGGILVFLILIQMGSFTIASGYVRSLSSVISSLVQWVSPLFYWSQGFSMVEYGNVGGYLLNLIFLIGLSLVLVLASHFAAKSRGVRE